ncbi:hypothetical protein CXB51_009141 [Gossypium anomalum]|uniref:Integrase catalytic domain-containing protein n=1 Tax=Gossypium anomalum TaxID=47600 RepID=A0A8J5YTV9_9ROSI|nr:hypothetical protein CXB51_009141 [Gossypium anomalum]
MACNIPKEAWERLKEEFMGSDKTRQQQLINLMRDFENLKMKESESIKQYSDRIMATVNSIRLLGEDFTESRIVEKRKANRQEEHSEGVFQARAKESSSVNKKGKKLWLDNKDKFRKDSSKRSYPPCTHRKRTTHSERNYWRRQDVQCWKCKQYGHVEKICRSKGKAPVHQQDQAHPAEDQQAQEEHVFSASSLVTTSKGKYSWLVDSGCSHHMAADVNLFKELDRSFSSRIRIGNGSLIKAKGRGDVLISSSTGNKLITDMLYVPDIDQNLLSVGQLVEKGYSLFFRSGSCVIEDSLGQEVVIVPMADKCFMLDVSQLERRAYLSQSDSVGLWHKRLGHANFRSLDLLYKLGLAEDMTKVEPLEGVCDKSDVFEAFGKFKAMVENQIGCRIKTLRTDNRAEYLSKRFKRLCEQAGIYHQLTTVYTPQQNGVCERKNRTVMNIARCLLFQSKLPNSFWAEAVNSSVYLLNRLPTHAVKDKTPFEAWYGLKPSVSHLKVFGCVCYVVVPAERGTKLEERSVPCIFVGYSSDKKGYRVYDPSTRKILVSRDIRFDEKKIWNWDGSNASQFEEDSAKGNLELIESEPSNGNVDDLPVRGTRSIADVYQRCNVAIVEPSSYEEAARDMNWKKAMEAEMDMIQKNQTWDLVERPEKKVIGDRWVFKAKFNADGTLNKHKARLVVKGYSQQYGVNFEKTFAPVARLDTIKLLFALAEEIYIEQSDGFQVKGQEDKVYRLKKALYGLKQAPRAWYDRVDAYLSKLGFEKSLSEPTLYVKKSKDETLLIVSIYVDNLLVTRSNNVLVNEFKAQMQEILDKFSMQNCKPVSTPMAQGEKLSSISDHVKVDEKEYRSLVGFLLYLTATRPDLMHAVSLLARCSKKQQTVAQSTVEAEYIAAAAAINQAIWLRKLLYDLNKEQLEPTEIKVDNQSAVAIAKNPVFHGKTEHFKIKFHFVREAEQTGEVSLVHCSSKDQLADILTKPLGTARFENLRNKIDNVFLHYPRPEKTWAIARVAVGHGSICYFILDWLQVAKDAKEVLSSVAGWKRPERRPWCRCVCSPHREGYSHSKGVVMAEIQDASLLIGSPIDLITSSFLVLLKLEYCATSVAAACFFTYQRTTKRTKESLRQKQQQRQSGLLLSLAFSSTLHFLNPKSLHRRHRFRRLELGAYWPGGSEGTDGENGGAKRQVVNQNF